MSCIYIYIYISLIVFKRPICIPISPQLQLEEEQDRYKTNERRLLQQQQRASERRKINLFDSQVSFTVENSKVQLNPYLSLPDNAL
jgi:hypothetical protein